MNNLSNLKKIIFILINILYLHEHSPQVEKVCEGHLRATLILCSWFMTTASVKHIMTSWTLVFIVMMRYSVLSHDFLKGLHCFGYINEKVTDDLKRGLY